MGKSAGSLKFIQLNEGAPTHQPAGPRPGKKMCQWDLLVLIGSWLAEEGVLLGNACRSRPVGYEGQETGWQDHLPAIVQGQGGTCNAAQSPSSSKSTALELWGLAIKGDEITGATEGGWGCWPSSGLTRGLPVP